MTMHRAGRLAGVAGAAVQAVGTGLALLAVLGRVLEIEELTQFKKPIRYCRVDVGAEHNDDGGDSRGIVCGATNFAEGDLVVVALPGARLPGDFEIAARKTYGHVSAGMICSAMELGLGEDHDGIIVLTEYLADRPEVLAALTPGDDLIPVLGLDAETVEVNVTPDRGYCLSMRGIAREYALSEGTPFVDPADLTVATATGPSDVRPRPRGRPVLPGLGARGAARSGWARSS